MAEGAAGAGSRELRDHAWVDAWVREDRARERWPAEAWKRHFIQVSKKLSCVLRHSAAEVGLDMREDGYVAMKDLLKHAMFRMVSREEIVACVEHNAKKRFLLITEAGEELIRAQQGHTAKVGNVDQRALTTPITLKNLPEHAIHGTFSAVVDKIRKQGLKTMGRDHIHMAVGLPSEGGVISGCRVGTDVFLHIDVRKAMVDGIEFMLSGNNVVLTPGRAGSLAPEYIMGATDFSGERVLFGFEGGHAAARRRVPGEPAGEPARAAAASAPRAAVPASALSSYEKTFMKAVKSFRDILKLEKRRDDGEKLEKLQLQKLEKKDLFLQEIAELECNLSKDSACREMCTDVLYVLCPGAGA